MNSQMFSSGLFNPLSLTIFAMLIGGFGWALVVLLRNRSLFNKRASALTSMVEDAQPANLVASRSAMRRQMQQSDSVLGPLWDEFDETLALTPDGTRLDTLVEAEYYFNRETIAVEFARNRLLAAVPGLLAAGGVFGTFLSLALGLGSLDLTGALSGAGQTNLLGAGVQNLIGAAGFAFAKSVVGVFLSLVFTVVYKLFEGNIAVRLKPINAKMGMLYRRVTPEDSLLQVAHFTRSSSEALQELHERIGNRLQESMERMSSDLESALTSAITLAMQPSMEKLVETTSRQSAEVFEELVGKFASSFTEIGERQSVVLDESSARLSTAIDRVSGEFSAIADHSRLQAAEMTARQSEMLAGLNATVEAFTGSAADLSSAAVSLGAATDAMQLAGESLTAGLSESASTLASLYDQAIQQAQAIAELHVAADGVESGVAGAAAALIGATDGLGTHLRSFRQSQEEFQGSLKSETDELAAVLRTHVAELEGHVSKWLVDYSADVERQIGDRMGLWDTHSRDYAGKMLATANALAQVLDDIQTRAAVERGLEEVQSALGAVDGAEELKVAQ